MNQFYKPGSGCLVQPCLPLIGLYRWCVHGVYHSKVVEALDVKLYDFVIYKLKLDKTRLMCLELYTNGSHCYFDCPETIW